MKIKVRYEGVYRIEAPDGDVNSFDSEIEALAFVIGLKRGLTGFNLNTDETSFKNKLRRVSGEESFDI